MSEKFYTTKKIQESALRVLHLIVLILTAQISPRKEKKLLHLIVWISKE